MLVVIVIITILAGMLFRLFTLVNRKSDRAETLEILERVADALNEYRAEYGMYPPVDEVGYEHENTNWQPEAFCKGYLPANKDFTGKPLFKFDNLVAHLWKRKRSGVWHTDGYAQWIGDTSRDLKAKSRWAHFLEGVPLYGNRRGYDASHITGVFAEYTNRVSTIVDSWENEIHYIAQPPFLTFRMWSNGPDGDSGTADDIHRNKWDN
jgi:type II secretory pathway pseudopilin PulG